MNLYCFNNRIKLTYSLFLICAIPRPQDMRYIMKKDTTLCMYRLI